MVTSLLRDVGLMMVDMTFDHYVTTEESMAFVAACSADELSITKRGYKGLSLSLEQAILLGMKPSVRYAVMKRQAGSDLGDWKEQPLKPLAAAAFFAQEGDMAEAKECLGLRQRAIDIYEAPGGKTTYVEESAKVTWVLPHFPALGLPELDMTRADSFLEAGAFNLPSIEAMLNKHTDVLRWSLARAAAARRHDLNTFIQDRAFKGAKRELISGVWNGISYKDLAEMIRMCPVESADYLMSAVGGTKSVIGALYESADPAVYRRGLAVLAQGLELNKDVLPYLVRGPTFKEIKKMRGIGITSLLHDMAWEYVEPLTHETGFKGLMLPFVEKLDPTYLREIPVDHPKRVALKSDIYKVSDINIHNWNAVSRKISQCYNSSIRFRQDLVRETGDPIISWMFMLGVFDKRKKSLDKVLSAHPNIRAIRKCLSTYEPPVRLDSNKTALEHI